MKNLFTALLFGSALLLTACSKNGRDISSQPFSSGGGAGATPTSSVLFVKYTIPAGGYTALNTTARTFLGTEMKFHARFDESARYSMVNPSHQMDINKLWGFTDNGVSDANKYSAQIGWRWSGGFLRIFAVVVNNGTVTTKEIKPVAFNTDVICSIKVTAAGYTFVVDDKTVDLPRLSTTPMGKGVQIYPGFGVNSPAPQVVNIWAKSL